MRCTVILNEDKDLFDKSWRNGIITFDTCSLGRMYEWEYNNALNIKDSISYLLTNESIWETEYNCYEFKVQREEIKNSIFQQKYENIFKQLPKRPVPWVKIDKTLHRWEERGYNPLFISELNELRTKKNISSNDIERLRMLAQRLHQYPNADVLFDAILNNSDIKLTNSDKEVLNKRYDNDDQICPGVCDRKKNNGNQYNDLYIWELLKRKAIKEEKDMIFVTADTKSDWFENGIARIEYLEEFKNETGRNILILSLTDFWECCREYIDLPVDDFIIQSTIKDQLEEKFDNNYEPDICEKVEDLIFESNEITLELERAIDCCVDMPIIDQINECRIEDIIPLPFEFDDYINVIVEMTVDITFIAQNHTGGEDWEAGSASVLFNMNALGSIPVKWFSEDTNRIVLEDTICVDEITDIIVCQSDYSTDEDSEEKYCDEMFDELYDEMYEERLIRFDEYDCF